jgi:16S rRNA processing protein RimM
LVRGTVPTAHGIRGLVRLVLRTDFPERVVEAEQLTLRLPDGEVRSYRVERMEPYKEGLLAKLEGVDDRDAAEALRGAEVVARADELPELPEGEYYWHQLRGLTVVTTDGRRVGVIKDILRTGSNDVYVTQIDRRREGPLIPAIPDVIERVDLQAGEVVIKPMPGLLE